MFRKICVPIDNSEHSNACIDAAVSLAGAFRADLVGSHVYAGGMHEQRFRQMEYTLPERYRTEEGLEQQRAVHQSLIGLGMQLISDSYLDALERRCWEDEVPFQRKTFDGKNWRKLVDDIRASDYDLVILGARGHGTERDSVLGSVCSRIARHVQTDLLVIKKIRPFEAAGRRGIVSAIDGSPESFAGLRAALALAKAYQAPVQAVAAYDPEFHYRVFHSMVAVLSKEAARVFRFQEQEELHEEIIDGGLARIYQSHLDVARRMAQEEGIELTTELLAGRPDVQILEHVEREQPWLLTVGRIGIHGEDGTEIGSNTENLLRSAGCNVLIAGRRYVPPEDIRAEEALVWTDEGRRLLDGIPEATRGAARTLVQRLALERGETVVTRELLKEATDALTPRGDQRDMMRAAAQAVALDTLRQGEGTAYLCQRCAYLSRGAKPERCPRCRAEDGSLMAVDREMLEALAGEGVNAPKREGHDGPRPPGLRLAGEESPGEEV